MQRIAVVHAANLAQIRRRVDTAEQIRFLRELAFQFIEVGLAWTQRHLFWRRHRAWTMQLSPLVLLPLRHLEPLRRIVYEMVSIVVDALPVTLMVWQ